MWLSCIDICRHFKYVFSFKMDLTLTFLDEFVCEALEAGAMPYRPQISHHLLGIPGRSLITGINT